MNAVEIEEAISKLAEQPFDPATFSYAFLEAFGNKSTTLKRLQSGTSNKTDIEGAVLQYNNIHMAVCTAGEVHKTLEKLRESPATVKQKAKYILATDGITLEAEDLTSDEPPMACDYPDFPDHFGFFLPLAGITTVKQIRESSFDIKATGRLNRLYVELLKDNPEWGTAARRPDMNHFMARLIFCFFAEDTDIFNGNGLFTATVEQMSARDSSNTHEVISEIFRAMNTRIEDRATAKLPRWADVFPYVNGNLFSGSTDTPRFSKIARSYLLNVGKLEWQKINPDIFGSMIQAVAEDEERGSLGMHYTSVSNIRKVLNPLFLDDLRAKLEEAGENARMLMNLRKRMAKIRVFDPACGSGNFLVIAYKDMREIEIEINRRRGEAHLRTEIPLTNFRGIELRTFPAEIARLALIIAEYQCDVQYRGQKEALAEFLPLDAQNWITCGNALRLDWLSICPPTGTGVKLRGDDLFSTPLDQAQIDFENEGGETYICGNPPYVGDKKQNKVQKSDVEFVLSRWTNKWRSLDYICGFIFKAAEYLSKVDGSAGLVSTNSICQGQQVPYFWPLILKNLDILFAYTSFKWSNLASNNAGVTVIIVGLSVKSAKQKKLYTEGTVRIVDNISPYLIPGKNLIVEACRSSISGLHRMTLGNVPKENGNLLLTGSDLEGLELSNTDRNILIRKVYGSSEFINSAQRYCLWIDNSDLELALSYATVKERIEKVRIFRLASVDAALREMANNPHQFREMNIGTNKTIIVPRVSSEARHYLPVGLLDKGCTITDAAYALYDADIFNIALLASRLHLVWIATICGQLETRIRYSNTMGWNTFPLPTLTEKNKADLTRCAEDILLTRETHFPATIAELYDPEKMPEDLRHAHERNDEVLERIYIGRRFKNDTERLEKLFDMYTKMAKKKEAA